MNSRNSKSKGALGYTFTHSGMNNTKHAIDKQKKPDFLSSVVSIIFP